MRRAEPLTLFTITNRQMWSSQLNLQNKWKTLRKEFFLVLLVKVCGS